MTQRDHHSTVPRPLLYGVGALILASLILAAGARIIGVEPMWKPQGEPLQSRELFFEDRSGGGVAVIDAASGAEIALIAPGTNGFVRVAMRGLARQRRVNGIGPETPFRLSLWPGGRLILEDPATGKLVNLGAFGPDNMRAFAQFLRSDRVEGAAQ
jgi:putative photosynthetic complex assembly protein